jgi:eukaryotic-like serine/threonine-protein kinase
VLLTAANRRERDATQQATQNYKESVRQRDRAEHNFQLAQDAVRDYFTRVSEETLLNQPGMQPLRDSLLRQALPYYQEFLAQRKDDPSLRQEVAQAEYFVGGITESINSPEEALSHYRAAADLQKQLVDQGDDEGAQSAAYAQTLNAMGRALQRLGRRDEARDYYDQAADVRGKLAAAKPTDPDRARAYASSLMNLGVLDYDAGAPEKALPQLKRAQSIRLAQTGWLDASSRQFVRDVGKGYYNIALAHLQLGDSPSAESSLFKAIDSFEKLYKLEPNDLVNRHQLANCRRMIADAKTAQDEPAEEDLLAAMELYEQAREELRELSVRNPDVPEFAADLAGVRMNLGAQWQATGKLDDALEELSGAVEQLRSLAENHTGVPRYRRDLGVSLRAAGQVLAELDRREEAREWLQESQQVLEKLVREHPQDAGYTEALQETLESLEELDAV